MDNQSVPPSTVNPVIVTSDIPNPTKPSSPSKSKVLVPILLLATVIILGLIGGVYWLFNNSKSSTPPVITNNQIVKNSPIPSLTPMPTTTASSPSTTLKTYNSKYKNFTFDYPKDYVYSEKSQNQPLSLNNSKKYDVVIVEFVNPTLSSQGPPPLGRVIDFSYVASPDLININLDSFIKTNYGNLYLSSKDVALNNGLKVKEVSFTCYLQPNKKCSAIVFNQGDTFINLSDPNFPDLTIPYLFLSNFKYTAS